MFLFLHQKTCKNDTPPLSGERLLEHIVYNLLLVSSKQALQPRTQAFDFLSPNMNERWLPSSQEKWAAADDEQFGRSAYKR